MTYSERTAKAEILSKWAKVKPPAGTVIKKITQERRRLWNALNKYITDQGGFVVSPPFASPLRIEIMPGSPLPARLRELGYTPGHAESITRVTGDGIKNADVIYIDLP